MPKMILLGEKCAIRKWPDFSGRVHRRKLRPSYVILCAPTSSILREPRLCVPRKRMVKNKNNAKNDFVR